MRKPTKTTVDAAAEITAFIIARIEAGTPPWKRPWTLGSSGRPLRHCGTPYTGINTLYLWAIADTCGYRSRYWMTYRQATELGGQVRRGEPGAHSVYYSSFTKQDATGEAGQGEPKTIRFLRAYRVFNADQIDGLPEHFRPDETPPAPIARSDRQDAIDAFFASIPSTVRHGGDQACYDRIADVIRLPEPNAFESADHLASTSAHEHVHWTGHGHRLARSFGKTFGDDAYAREELVAELGAGLICADLGLANEIHDSHASYIAHWLRILRGDKSAIISAASKAEAAYRYLMSFAEPVSNDSNVLAAAREPSEPVAA